MEGKTNKRSPRKLSAALMALLLVMVVVVNIGGGMFYNVITQFFSKVEIDSALTGAAAATAHEVAERVSEEGMVLLENRDSALPLDLTDEKQASVNVFGWRSVFPLYSATGSASGSNENAVSLYDGLTNSGFQVNDELCQFYLNSNYTDQSVDSFGRFSLDYNKIQVPMDEYPEDIWANARTFSDVALVMISRTGGEGNVDLPTSMESYGGLASEHYLELSESEKQLLSKIESLGFRKTIILINAGQPMELGFLNEYGIDAALWIGYGGEDGMNALGQLLSGKVNPSGRLVDTYAFDATSSPAFQNQGAFNYTNVTTAPDFFNPNGAPYGVVSYCEGIYVGYRYYETRWIDNTTGECDEEAYHAAVQYPFGYGLSYTSFDQKITGFSENDGVLTVTAEVTNTGDVPGKDVVQVYYTAPYTMGGIEKAHVVLAGFGKTGLLNPGATESVTITFTEEDMASFDDSGTGCYVLEQGDYEIKLMKNAHEVIDSRTYTVASTIVYDENNKRSTDLEAAVSRFQDAEGDLTFLSRADWEGTFPQMPDRELVASDEVVAALTTIDYGDDPNTPDIIVQDHGLKLSDMIGLAYDDPKWEQLLEQLSVEDMQNLIGFGGYATQAVKSVDKPYTVDLDGPGGIRALVQDNVYKTVGYPTAPLLSSTWNPALVEEMAAAFGAEADAWGVSGLYGPTMNIRREPFGSRNSEYYSEDGLLSAKMAAAFVNGVQSKEVYCYIKHFVLFDQVSNATRCCIWFNEQSLRELYLKPFEECVKYADAKAVMTCYNLLGTTWAGASSPLLMDVLRGEWGFHGQVITDAYMGVANIDLGIRNGTDLALSTTGVLPQDNSPAARQAMRRACHDILYTTANSNAMRIGNYGPTPYWLYVLIAVDVVVVVLEGFFFYRWNKKRKEFAASKGSETC